MLFNNRVWFAFTFLGGLLLGLGGFTFNYAEGLSYLSDNPEACINCHVMEPQYNQWRHASHGRVATCNDCHVPHDFIGKWYTKAENGLYHSIVFTMGTYPDNITARQVSVDVVQANCLYCHSTLVQPTLNIVHPSEVSCLNCHRSVGHGD